MTGFEPATPWLQTRCSTTELHPQSPIPNPQSPPVSVDRGPEAHTLLMATTKQPRAGVQTKAQSLRSFDPKTGTVLEEIPASTPDDLREGVARAREAQPAWAALPVRERAAAVGEVRREIGRRMDDLIDTICRENGKPRAEAVSHDV